MPQRLARLGRARPHIALPHVPGHELAGAVAAVGARRRPAGGSATGSPCRSSAPAAPARRAWRATTRSATGRPSPGSPAGAPSPSWSRSTTPTSTWSRCPTTLDAVDRGRARLPVRDGATAPSSRQGRVHAGRLGRGARLRRGRAVRRDGRGGGAAPGSSRSTSARARSSSPASFGATEVVDASTHGRRRAPSGPSPAAARTCRWTRWAATTTCGASVRSLRKRGRHVQVGPAARPTSAHPADADGPGDRPRAGDRRQPRDGRARLPGDARDWSRPAGCAPTCW